MQGDIECAYLNGEVALLGTQLPCLQLIASLT
jgi:hypothetical protein